MKWYEQAKAEEWDVDTEPPSPNDILLGSSAAAASASSGIARALDTLVDFAPADQKWEPPSSEEEEVEKQRKEMLADIKGKLRPGVDRHCDGAAGLHAQNCAARATAKVLVHAAADPGRSG